VALPAELALDGAAKVLKGAGHALIKVFQGLAAGQGFSLGVACWKLNQVQEQTNCRVPAGEAAFEDE
jgi:hypothetical protein